jgi:MFS family permease
MPSVALFLTASSIAVMAIVFVIDEHPRPHGHVSSRWFPPPVLLPGIVLGLGNVTYAAMAGFLILLLHHRGHGTAWAFSAFAVAVLFGRAAFGGLPDRMGPRRSLLAGYVLLALGLIAIVAGLSWQFDVPAALLIGLGYSFPWPALASVVVSQVPVSERAMALGALNAFYDLFVAGSSAVAGAAAGRWGFTAPFWIALGCVAAATVMVLTIGVGTKSHALVESSRSEPAGARR